MSELLALIEVVDPQPGNRDRAPGGEIAVAAARVHEVTRIRGEPCEAVPALSSARGNVLPLRLGMNDAPREWGQMRSVELRELLRRELAKRGSWWWARLAADHTVLYLDGIDRFEAERDEPGIVSRGFERLTGLLGHALKHVAALRFAPGDRAAVRARWAARLAPSPGFTRPSAPTPDAWSQALQDEGCPASQTYAEDPMPDGVEDPCWACTAARRTRCVGLGGTLLQAYQLEARAVLVRTATPGSARHIHATEMRKVHQTWHPHARIVVAADLRAAPFGILELVLKGPRPPDDTRDHLPVATIFEVDVTHPGEARAAMQWILARNVGTPDHAVVGSARRDVEIHVPPSWSLR